MLVFIGSFILTIIAAFFQATNWILFDATIKPNLIFVVLMILGIINSSWVKRAILILVAALILKFTPGFSLLDLTFIGATVASIILMDFLPWQQPINLLLAVTIGTIIINLDRLTFLPLTYELILNLLLAFVLFSLLKLVHVPQIKLQRNRF